MSNSRLNRPALSALAAVACFASFASAQIQYAYNIDVRGGGWLDIPESSGPSFIGRPAHDLGPGGILEALTFILSPIEPEGDGFPAGYANRPHPPFTPRPFEIGGMVRGDLLVFETGATEPTYLVRFNFAIADYSASIVFYSAGTSPLPGNLAPIGLPTDFHSKRATLVIPPGAFDSGAFVYIPAPDQPGFIYGGATYTFVPAPGSAFVLLSVTLASARRRR